ncbi:hypothetical protein Noda2021_11380 [Candidatus Dependentiae bacterium Noda2021]|nr:hypothetical protein Noda2021_11380 [Candidatus Dependentiae bacterium Noda2021]
MIKKKKNNTSWVKKVQETSNAMDLPEGIFTWSAKDIAQGLMEAVLESDRTKGTKFQSAMSMLNLYINRAGKKLPDKDKARLEKAKNELRILFGKPTQ